MQESLDDAIWVLKSHAESSSRTPVIPNSFPPPPPPHYPPGLTDQLQNAPLEHPGALEATNILLNNMNLPRSDGAHIG